MALGLVYAPGRQDRPVELEAADVHASTLPSMMIAFQKPDAETVRGEAGDGGDDVAFPLEEAA